MASPHKKNFDRSRLQSPLLAIFSILLLTAWLSAAPTADDGPPLRSPHAYALCIGINYSSIDPSQLRGITLPPLSSAENDANAVSQALQTHYGFNSVIRLTGAFATRARIRTAIFNILNKLDRDDSLFIFYAGHGLKHDFDVDGFPTSEGYLVPVDCLSKPDATTPESYASTFISMREVAKQIQSNKIARHIVLCLDCCYSGFAVEPRSTEEQAARNYRNLMINPSRIVITAGTEDQRSYELSGHGLFTTALLRALNDPVKKQQPVCATELYADLRTYATTLSKDNDCPFSPQMRSLLVRSPVGEIVFLPDTAKKWEAQIAAVPEKSSDDKTTPPDEMENSIANAQRSADSGQDKQNDPVAQKSYAQYNERASAGDPNAMAVLHYYDRLGYGTRKNPERAQVWAADTANAGLPLGQLLLADCFSEGIGVPKNPATANLLRQRAGPSANTAFGRMGARNNRQQPGQQGPQPSPADFVALGAAIGEMSSHSGAGAKVSVNLDKDLRKKIIQVIKHRDIVKSNLDDIDRTNDWRDLDGNLTDWNKAITDMKTAAASTPQASAVNAVAADLQKAISGVRTKELDLLKVATRREFDKSAADITQLQNLGQIDPASQQTPTKETP